MENSSRRARLIELLREARRAHTRYTCLAYHKSGAEVDEAYQQWCDLAAEVVETANNTGEHNGEHLLPRSRRGR